MVLPTIEAPPPAVAPGTAERGTGNLLLQHVAEDEFARLRPHLARVPIAFGETFVRAGDPLDTIYFLEGALAGFLDVLPDGRRLSLGILGREGAIGWPALMGEDRWPWDVQLCVCDTTALALPVEVLRAEAGGSLYGLMLRFAAAVSAQMGRTIVSNLIHPVDRRAARWILLYHDRVDGDAITLTHEELGLMLGVRRASITNALHDLEGQGAIRGLRGRIVIRDRARLEAIAGETYGFAEATYRRLIAAA